MNNPYSVIIDMIKEQIRSLLENDIGRVVIIDKDYLETGMVQTRVSDAEKIHQKIRLLEMLEEERSQYTEPLKQGIKEELDIVRQALRTDEGYYHSWQANIAMAFKDQFDKDAQKYDIYYSPKDIHEIANEAAQNFLNQLIRE